MSTYVIRVRRFHHASIAIILLLGSISLRLLSVSAQSVSTSSQSRHFDNGYRVGDKEELHLSLAERLTLRKIVAKTPRKLKHAVRFTFAPYLGAKKSFLIFLLTPEPAPSQGLYANYKILNTKYCNEEYDPIRAIVFTAVSC